MSDPTQPIARFRLVLCSVLCVLVSVVSSAQSEPGSEKRDAGLILFVGLDLMVNSPAGMSRVEDYRRNTMLIGSEAGMQTVHSRDVKEIRTAREPKISATEVQIDDLDTRRDFTVLSDPTMEAMQTQSALLDYQSQRQAQVDNAYREMEATQARAASLPPQQREASIQQAQQRLDSAQQDLRIINMDPYSMQNRSTDADAFDTFRATFTVASPVEIRGAYALLLATIRLPGPVPKLASRFALAEIPVISAEPSKVRLTLHALPPGFTVHAHEVHVYAEGRELASNLSAGRTALSRSEAHTFLTLQREQKHRHDDIPAEVATALLPAANRTQIPDTHAHRTARVTIDSDGQVTSATLDTAGSPEIDAPIEAAVRATPFFPTLRAGRPVASTLTFNLSELRP